MSNSCYFGVWLDLPPGELIMSARSDEHREALTCKTVLLYTAWFLASKDVGL